MFGSKKQVEGCGQWISTKSKRNFRQPAPKNGKKRSQKSLLKRDHIPNVFISSSPIPEKVKKMLRRAKQCKMDKFLQARTSGIARNSEGQEGEFRLEMEEENEGEDMLPRLAGVCKRRHQQEFELALEKADSNFLPIYHDAINRNCNTDNGFNDENEATENQAMSHLWTSGCHGDVNNHDHGHNKSTEKNNISGVSPCFYSSDGDSDNELNMPNKIYPMKEQHTATRQRKRPNEYPTPSPKRFKDSENDFKDSQFECSQEDGSPLSGTFQYTQWVQDQVKKCKEIQNAIDPLDFTGYNKSTKQEKQHQSTVLSDCKMNSNKSATILKQSLFHGSQKDRLDKLNESDDSEYSFKKGKEKSDLDVECSSQSSEASFQFTQWVNEQRKKCKQLQNLSQFSNFLNSWNSTRIPRDADGSNSLSRQCQISCQDDNKNTLCDASNDILRPGKTETRRVQMGKDGQENNEWQESESFRFSQWVMKQRQICKNLQNSEVVMPFSEND